MEVKTGDRRGTNTLNKKRENRARVNSGASKLRSPRRQDKDARTLCAHADLNRARTPGGGALDGVLVFTYRKGMRSNPGTAAGAKTPTGGNRAATGAAAGTKRAEIGGEQSAVIRRVRWKHSSTLWAFETVS